MFFSFYLFVICMNVLLKMLDGVVVRGKIRYYLKCKNFDLIYLCFADDLMIFVDGIKYSIEGILRVFEEFDKISGLKISMEKLILFMVRIVREEEIVRYGFIIGKFLVRYLGFLFLIKNMIVIDFFFLVEKIIKRISF